MPRIKKPNLKADLDILKKALDEAKMNPDLINLFKDQLQRELNVKDYIAYGRQLQYRLDYIESWRLAENNSND